MRFDITGDNRGGLTWLCYNVGMFPDPAAPHEVSQDPVEIRADNEITIPAALTLAQEASLPLGLSTLQRWAKLWAQQGAAAEVKTVLVTNRSGKVYKLDREDFQVWLFDQKQNVRGARAPAGLERPAEISRNPERSRDTSQDLPRPRKIPEDPDEVFRVKELESENMNLKIDLGVRKQLLDRVREEMDQLRSMADNLLRENGALHYQIKQLPAPPPASAEPMLDRGENGPVDNSERAKT